jgi:uncharacterized membrane protein
VTSLTKALLMATASGLASVIRFSLYVLLLLAGRILLPAANLAIIVGLVVFLFCAFLRPDLQTPMWAGAGLAAAATAASFFYDAALRLAAPEGTVIVRDA